MVSRSIPYSVAERARGFTILELMVVMAIAGVLAALAVPAMRQFMQNQQDSTAASQLISNLNYARSEAIKEDVQVAGGGGVQVCASTGAGANPTCDTANWASGWIVLSSKSAIPLQVVGALPTGVTLTTTPANSTVLFQANGTTPAVVVGGNSRVMFRVCDTRGANFAREVEISVTGIIQASSQPGFDVSGAALVCP